LHILVFTNVYSRTITKGTGPVFASTSEDIETYIRTKQSPSHVLISQENYTRRFFFLHLLSKLWKNTETKLITMVKIPT
jgi:hypothetical protein